MNLEGFVFLQERKQASGPWAGLLRSPRVQNVGQIDVSATGTAGDQGMPDPQGKAPGREEASLKAAVQPISTHPRLGITEMVLAKSRRRAWGFVCR